MSTNEVITYQQDTLDKAAKVRLLALDVDGVLTDGKLYFANSGEELKSFSTLDGQGIKLLQANGVDVALITARQSALVARRAADLGIRHLIQNCGNKLAALNALLAQLKLEPEQAAYVGDDLPDLACIHHVGLGISVPNGHFSARVQASLVTHAAGGDGAVREICDLILLAQDKLDMTIVAWLENA